ncbi:Uncharacterised protein [Atlantibacter hermannii]|nr:Uncharacterised protein [Atlantibacter hermannii]
MLNSKEVSAFINSKVWQQMAASLVTSIAGAFSTLGYVLSEQAKAGVTRMLQAVAFVAEGSPAVTVFSGELKVRDFQILLRHQLDVHGKSVWSGSVEEGGEP